jgi:hypothetical protein
VSSHGSLWSDLAPRGSGSLLVLLLALATAIGATVVLLGEGGYRPRVRDWAWLARAPARSVEAFLARRGSD